MIIGSRIRERRKAAGLSQESLAQQVGIGQSTIAALERGDQRTSAYLHKIGAVLGTTPAYLTGDTNESGGDVPPPATVEAAAQRLDLVPIDFVDLTYGMGAGNSELPVEVQPQFFPRAWLTSVTKTPPPQLFFAYGRGDSMMPTLLDGDLLMIDRSQRNVRELDVLWAFSMGPVLAIKRLRPRADGMMAILSDNASVPTEVVSPEEIHIVGRVIYIGRRV